MLPELAYNVTIASFFEHPETDEPLTTLTRLELPAGLATNLMARAGLLFPSVTELVVGYQTIVSLRQIWTMWPKLESLHLSVVDYDEESLEDDFSFLSLDALLTGFDEAQLKMAKDQHHCVIEQPKFPSINNLKCQ